MLRLAEFLLTLSLINRLAWAGMIGSAMVAVGEEVVGRLFFHAAKQPCVNYLFDFSWDVAARVAGISLLPMKLLKATP